MSLTTGSVDRRYLSLANATADTIRSVIRQNLYGGSTVVSMRPIRVRDLDAVQNICARYPHARGKPLHAGDPAEIGITDLNAPQWGGAVTINDDELPVFWACGVTTQVAIAKARPHFCITHAPGAMLITEIDETSGPVSRLTAPLGPKNLTPKQGEKP